MHAPLTFNLQNVSLVNFFLSYAIFERSRFKWNALKKFIESIGHIDFSYKCFLVSLLWSKKGKY